jgi:phospholipase/lecithinase/hemolysin
MHKLFISVPTLLFVFVLLAGGSNARAGFTDLYVFGDSLSDEGNISNETGGAAPGPDYYMGRFSSGPVAAEVAAQVHLGKQLTPSVSGGAGAQNISVPKAPDLGLIPEVTQLGSAAIAGATLLSSLFNSSLDQLLAGFAGTENIISPDTFAIMNAVISNPDFYGLTNVTDPFLGSGATNPDEYFFFDSIHPTEAVHAIIGPQLIPEPGMIALLLVGAGVALLRHRRFSA